MTQKEKTMTDYFLLHNKPRISRSIHRVDSKKVFLFEEQMLGLSKFKNTDHMIYWITNISTIHFRVTNIDFEKYMGRKL